MEEEEDRAEEERAAKPGMDEEVDGGGTVPVDDKPDEDEVDLGRGADAEGVSVSMGLSGALGSWGGAAGGGSGAAGAPSGRRDVPRGNPQTVIGPVSMKNVPPQM